MRTQSVTTGLLSDFSYPRDRHCKLPPLGRGRGTAFHMGRPWLQLHPHSPLPPSLAGPHHVLLTQLKGTGSANLHYPGAVRSFWLEATRCGPSCSLLWGPLAAPAAPLGIPLASMTALACASRHGLVVGGTHCSGQAQPCNPAQIWMPASSSWLFSQTILLESNRLHKCQETRPSSDAASMK